MNSCQQDLLPKRPPKMRLPKHFQQNSKKNTLPSGFLAKKYRNQSALKLCKSPTWAPTQFGYLLNMLALIETISTHCKKSFSFDFWILLRFGWNSCKIQKKMTPKISPPPTRIFSNRLKSSAGVSFCSRGDLPTYGAVLPHRYQTLVHPTAHIAET